MSKRSEILKARSFVREIASFMPSLQRKLLKLRKDNIKAAIEQCRQSYSLSPLEQISEPYLADYIKRLYVSVATYSAQKSVADFLGKSSIQDEIWYNPLMRYIEEITGERIVLLQGSLQKQMKEILNEVIPQTTIDGYSIEDITQEVYKKWGKVAEWQVRRIVNTETLCAASEGQFASIDGLGVNYSKTWLITGINTRDAHKAMLGVSVGRDDVFVLPNGDKMRFPRDLKFNAEAGNIVNCACFCSYAAAR